MNRSFYLFKLLHTPLGNPVRQHPLWVGQCSAYHKMFWLLMAAHSLALVQDSFLVALDFGKPRQAPGSNGLLAGHRYRYAQSFLYCRIAIHSQLSITSYFAARTALTSDTISVRPSGDPCFLSISWLPCSAEKKPEAPQK